MSQSSLMLEQIIRDRITHSANNKIPFVEFMDLVLYHPEWGYYSGGKVEIGSRGDFFTSVSLGADFGELLAIQLVQMWQVLGQPQPFILLEMGAGNGDLARDILQTLEAQFPAVFAALEYWIVEQSPALIQRQKAVLADYTVQWQDESEIEDESLTGCIFANELVDAFPVHQVRVEDEGLKEVYVTYSEAGLIEVTGELSTPQLANYFRDMAINLTQEDYVKPYQTEVNLAALSWLKTVASKLKKGYLMTIDYGYSAQRYYNPRRDRGTLQCYYQHRRHNNPYINLGQQDITTHVNFTALQYYGQQYGLTTLGQTKQGMFLMALGLGEKLNALSRGEFDAAQILHRRDALHQLIDPTGLGGFEVLIQAQGLRDAETSQPLKGLFLPEF
ncbi:MAG: class I SAM-dependent methyltransferase [Jaaginema sp. PMC 1079.18]|nr:class I SAM-dependent methyltransferase [Jaaginema sp. PMC 1080.18]MEC4852876.1 class I SAM-dependent methyltransferase [Jaaginema sp. PMC 1079.18]MEC4867846.1 class I SAM-dependent methyltransferase [Jaaginema sp. PMC 1078.18]